MLTAQPTLDSGSTGQMEKNLETLAGYLPEILH